MRASESDTWLAKMTDRIRPVVEQVLRDEQSETVGTVETETTDPQYDKGHDSDMTSNKRKQNVQLILTITFHFNKYSL